jgi:hypothetical protein
VTQSPGLPPANNPNGPEDIAQLNGWDWDTDGHGNRRIADRRYAATRPAAATDSRIDIGADESNELTISGYLTSTRIYSRDHNAIAEKSSAFPAVNNLYYFNFYQGSNPTMDYLRPGCNFAADATFATPHQRLPGSEWFNQANTNPYHTVLPGTSNYTDGKFDDRVLGGNVERNFRWWLVDPASAFEHIPIPEFMRNLACDFSPHLSHDIPPDSATPANWYIWWGERYEFVRPGTAPYPTYSPYTNIYQDVFKANPWYANANALLNEALWTDNSHLYYDPADPLKWTLTGHVAPPLTLPQDTLVNPTKSYLFTNSRHAYLWYEFGPQGVVYKIGPNGFTAAPDYLVFYPGSLGMGCG